VKNDPPLKNVYRKWGTKSKVVIDGGDKVYPQQLLDALDLMDPIAFEMNCIGNRRNGKTTRAMLDFVYRYLDPNRTWAILIVKNEKERTRILGIFKEWSCKLEEKMPVGLGMGEFRERLDHLVVTSDTCRPSTSFFYPTIKDLE
jgi:hypothetical protein